MNVSLDQAIEIHAKALKHRFGKRAALLAQERAQHCAARGDDEGHDVWQRVAAVSGMLPDISHQPLSVAETRQRLAIGVSVMAPAPSPPSAKN
jgi:hypothetical protein